MRPEKTQLVADIRALIEASNGLFLLTYEGLSAMGFGALRAALEEVGGECHVVPNRLLRRAADESGMADLAGTTFVGGTVLVTFDSDLVGVAKVVRDFARVHDVVAFKLAVADGQVCMAAEAAALADLPPKEILRAQLLGLLNAPAGQLVGVLNAKVAGVVHILSAYLSKKEQAA